MNIGHLLTEIVTVKRISGHSASGDPTRGASFTAKARVQRAPGDGPGVPTGRDAAGGNTVLTEVELRVGDVLWFAEDNTGDANAGHTVTAVAQRRTLDGRVTHYTASC